MREEMKRQDIDCLLLCGLPVNGIQKLRMPDICLRLQAMRNLIILCSLVRGSRQVLF